jgi:hypothetical protein
MDETSCELKVFGGWQPITLEEALRLHPSRVKRCPVCHERVRTHKAGDNGMAAHFEHYERNPGRRQSAATSEGSKMTPSLSRIMFTECDNAPSPSASRLKGRFPAACEVARP